MRSCLQSSWFLRPLNPNMTQFALCTFNHFSTGLSLTLSLMCARVLFPSLRDFRSLFLARARACYFYRCWSSIYYPGVKQLCTPALEQFARTSCNYSWESAWLARTQMRVSMDLDFNIYYMYILCIYTRMYMYMCKRAHIYINSYIYIYIHI